MCDKDTEKFILRQWELNPKGFENISKKISIPDKLDSAKTNFKKPEIKISFFEKIFGKIILYKKQKEFEMWNTIKSFLVAKIVQWLLKVGAGVLLTLGISQNSLEEIVGAIVSLLIGIIYSLLTHKKVALTNPKEFLKYE